MTINQEVDALRPIGINPVRYLVAPSLIAMLVMLPTLTMWCNIVSMTAAGLFVSADTGISLAAYAINTIDVLTPSEPPRTSEPFNAPMMTISIAKRALLPRPCNRSAGVRTSIELMA